ncbi:response regulator [Photobacterium japonica]|uniref:response regulator n=1 Tax=Photobacterium japonica TaxID=2910235 RepID=UPI003D0FCC16
MLKKVSILICDDSPVVHRSMLKQLGCFDGVVLYFAENEQEALERLAISEIDVLFWGSTMPVIVGFDVLRLRSVNPHPTQIIVLSAEREKPVLASSLANGDVRCLLKSFTQQQLLEMLTQCGFPLSVDRTSVQSVYSATLADTSLPDTAEYITAFKNVANVALGRGAAIISDHFGESIKMPFPNVAMLSAGELAMTINDIRQSHQTTAIAQRFVGGGIHGEALVSLCGEDIYAFGERLGFSQVDEYKSEIVIDIANLMVSSFLVSLSDQLMIPFSVRQPILMEEYMAWGERKCEINELFTVEYRYQSELLDVECHVLFMLDQHSTQVIKQMMETLH